MRSFIIRKPLAVAAAVAAWIPTTVALGAQPSFDCAKAEGAVEALICKDADLAALDLKLSEVYGMALKQHEASAPQAARCRAANMAKAGCFESIGCAMLDRRRE